MTTLQKYKTKDEELNPDYAIEKVHSWLFYNYRL